MKRQTKFGIVLAAAAVISVSVASLVCARGWVQQGADWYYADGNNEFVTETIQSSGNSKFYLDSEGKMARDYFLEDYNGNTYYFGSNGAMVTNTWVAVDSSIVENQGDYVPDNYWYYFQASGKAMKGTSTSPKKTTIDGKKYLFNENGQMCTGWVKDSGEIVSPDEENPFKDATYYAGGDNDGVLRAGWVTYYDGYDADDGYQTDYTNLYFYFSPTNNKKEVGDGGTPKTKKINGRTYAFDGEGIMLSGWDVYEQTNLFRDADGNKQATYFSGEDDGHQVKKGWVYAVPNDSIDSAAHRDDEEKYMYFNNSGIIVTDQFKKINGKYYVFNGKGVMKTGLILWCNSGSNGGTSSKYVDKLDLDWANGSDLVKGGFLVTDQGTYIRVNTDGVVIGTQNNGNADAGDKIKIHYYGEDGARKTGLNNVEFADDTYAINTVGSSGDKGTGSFSKKYYMLGVLLKASPDIRYGIYQRATDSMLKGQKNINLDGYKGEIDAGSYYVLNTGGSLQTGSNSAKKDADGNYWMIDKTTKELMGIYSQNIKVGESSFTTRKIINDYGFVNNTNYSTSQIITRLGDNNDLFIDEYATAIGANRWATSNLAGMTWKASTNSNGEVQFTSVRSITGGWFQSESGDSASKWIPFGMKDNSGNTATFCHVACDNIPRAKAYEVTPNNDYFVNCYYEKLNSWVND